VAIFLSLKFMGGYYSYNSPYYNIIIVL